MRIMIFVCIQIGSSIGVSANSNYRGLLEKLCARFCMMQTKTKTNKEIKNIRTM